MFLLTRGIPTWFAMRLSSHLMNASQIKIQGTHVDVIPSHGLQPFMADFQPRVEEGTMHLRRGRLSSRYWMIIIS